MNIKIYVITHKFIKFNLNEIYNPLFVGAHGKNTYNYLRDDTGDNISEKNKYYSEITGLYWMWKNSEAEIIGLCHYRRFFAKGILGNGDYLTKEDILSDLKDYDIIAYKRKTGRTIFDNFQEYVSKDNMIKGIKILKEMYPDYSEDLDYMLEGNELYSNSMFISYKTNINDYCNILFPYLNKLENELDLSIKPRIIGYFAEIFFSLYITHNNLKVKKYQLDYIGIPLNILNVINSFSKLDYFRDIVVKSIKKYKK